MRLMIRCDVEGVTGVVHPTQADPASPGFDYGVNMLHEDVNAVVAGLLSTGEHEIWIYDMHYYGRNLAMNRLDPRVRVVCGKPLYRPGDVGGLTAGFDGQILVGLHSKAGTGELLSHSYEHQIQDLILNGISVGEIGMEAALAGELGVPTILVSGDSAGCAEATALIPSVVTVSVKDSLGLHQGVCYPVPKTAERLRLGAQKAISHLKEIRPYRVKSPISLVMRLEAGTFSDHVRSQLQSSVLPDGRIDIRADSVAAAWLKYLQARP